MITAGFRRILQWSLTVLVAAAVLSPGEENSREAAGAFPVSAVATTAVFAHIAVGGPYTTVFTFMNTGTTPLTGTLFLTDDSGRPLTVSLTETLQYPEGPSAGRVNAIGPSLPLSIAPGGTQFLAAGPAVPGDPTWRRGWARVESEGGTLGGVATFQYSPGGVLQSIAGVLASDPVENATIPVDNDDPGQRYTGFALANPGGAPVTIRVVPVDQNGVVVPGLALSISLEAGAQDAKFLHEVWTGPAALSFQGSVVLIAPAGKGIAVVALVQNQGLLSATPVIPSKAPAVN